MLLTLLTFIIVLGLLVFVHELGHFFVARRSRVGVEEFGFGLPPRIFGMYKDPETKKWKAVARKNDLAPATIYSLNWVPLGGFVKIKGEQGEFSEDSDSFAHKPIWGKIKILSAGVTMNVLLAIVLLWIGYTIGLPREINDSQNYWRAKISNETIYITDTVKGFPADTAGIKPGDAIVSLDGKTFLKVIDLQNYIQERTQITIEVIAKRKGSEMKFSVTPKEDTEAKKTIIGVVLAKMGVISYPWYIAFWESIKTTLYLIKEIIVAFYFLFVNLITAQKVAISLSGPVGIAVITGEVARMGFIYILQFTALLSLNLAIINFLPLPALDGGRVAFLIIEKIRGKAINARVENIIHSAGLYLLFLLVLLITYSDVLRFSDKFVSLWKKITHIF